MIRVLVCMVVFSVMAPYALAAPIISFSSTADTTGAFSRSETATIASGPVTLTHSAAPGMFSTNLTTGGPLYIVDYSTTQTEPGKYQSTITMSGANSHQSIAEYNVVGMGVDDTFGTPDTFSVWLSIEQLVTNGGTHSGSASLTLNTANVTGGSAALDVLPGGALVATFTFAFTGPVTFMPTSYNILSVPEPSSMLLLMPLAAAALCRRH